MSWLHQLFDAGWTKKCNPHVALDLIFCVHRWPMSRTLHIICTCWWGIKWKMLNLRQDYIASFFRALMTCLLRRYFQQRFHETSNELEVFRSYFISAFSLNSISMRARKSRISLSFIVQLIKLHEFLKMIRNVWNYSIRKNLFSRVSCDGKAFASSRNTEHRTRYI